jgi:hypothetical protein
MKISKKQLKEQIFSQLLVYQAFWSYDVQKLADITDNLLIEKTLLYGDVEEILLLFRVFTIQEIREVWRNSVIPDERFYPRNYYLAKIFFNIKNPARYIKPLQKKLSRYEKLNSL